MIVGDALIGDPPGKLRLVPEPKIQSRKDLESSVDTLRDIDFDILLLGDGTHILEDAQAWVGAFFKTMRRP